MPDTAQPTEAPAAGRPTSEIAARVGELRTLAADSPLRAWAARVDAHRRS